MLSTTRRGREEPRLSGAEHFLDERSGVEDEGHALIPELRRPSETAHRLQRFSERLDDDVLLPHELVDDETQSPSADTGDDDERPRPRPRSTNFTAKSRASRQMGSDTPRTDEHLARLDMPHMRLVESNRLFDVREGHGEKAPPDLDQEDADDRQRDRQA